MNAPLTSAEVPRRGTCIQEGMRRHLTSYKYQAGVSAPSPVVFTKESNVGIPCDFPSSSLLYIFTLICTGWQRASMYE